MRILFITTPSRLSTPNYMIPSGILALAAYMRKFGHLVYVVDAALKLYPHDLTARLACDFKPDLIGVGGIITSYSFCVGLTRALKKIMPNVPIVLGGQVTINNTVNCFEHMPIDYMVYGYGEIPLQKIVQHLEGKLKIEGIPGISYRKGDIVHESPGREFVEDINSLPLPAYDLVDMEYYVTVFKKNPTLDIWLKKCGKTTSSYRLATIMGALGCVARCTFCVHEQEYLGIKYFSHEYVLNHLAYLYQQYGVRIFAIGEEMFLSNVNRVLEFNKLLLEKYPDVYWRTATRSDFINEQLVRALDARGSNCYTVVFGYESGSQRILDIMNKGTKREDNIRAYKLLRSSQALGVAAALMVGNVGENMESIKETISSIHECGLYDSTVFFTSPYPGGRIWDWACENKIITDTHEYLMAVSNVDPTSRINVNLTPYPNWVLWFWKGLIIWHMNFEKYKHLQHEWSFKQKFSFWMRGLFPLSNSKLVMSNGSISSKRLKAFCEIFLTVIMRVCPIWFIKISLWVYFVFPKKSIPEKYYFNTDSKGALLPKRIRKGSLQRYLIDQELRDLSLSDQLIYSLDAKKNV